MEERGGNEQGRDRTESRHPNRVDVGVEVTIYCHGFVIAQRKSQNIGIDGMRIQTQPLPISRKNTFVEVEFELGDPEAMQRFRLPVFVGRRATDVTLGELELIFREDERADLARFGTELGNALAATGAPDFVRQLA